MRNIYFLLLAAIITVFSSTAEARMIGRGYSDADFRTLTQSYLALYKGGNPTDVMLDEYAEMAYCDLYETHFSNDFEWNKIRNGIRQDFLEYNTNIPMYYQIVGTVKVGRYNFEDKAFPLIKGHENVGKLYVFSPGGYFSYCGKTGGLNSLPATYVLVLFEPLTLQAIKIPPKKAKEVVELMGIDKDGDRKLYARYRFRFLDFQGVSGQKQLTAEFKGQIQEIDFFLDEELTQKVHSISFVEEF